MVAVLGGGGGSARVIEEKPEVGRLGRPGGLMERGWAERNENGKQEKHLVATVGKFSVIWNFMQVKNSNHECYRNQEGFKSCYCYPLWIASSCMRSLQPVIHQKLH
ncbi:hypothetical protein M5K25_027942 [Dendrobium thyrsiflorum]|uniref:Uncharacterized protein n=1 Tax=Dendrobium thyrsiflorum TaxID=117978 RepID=A0ABD0TVE5_DENTH